MSDALQNALDRWDSGPGKSTFDDLDLFVDAARRVVNPVGKFEANVSVVVWTEGFGFATAAYTSLPDGEYLVIDTTEDTG